jgi:hypothetical protein
LSLITYLFLLRILFIFLNAERVLVFENFYHVANDVKMQGGGNQSSASYPMLTTPERYKNAALGFCNVEEATWGVKYPDRDEAVLKKACFVLSFAYTLLVDGLHFGADKAITVQQEVQVGGSKIEVDWVLGSAYKEAVDYSASVKLRR